MPDICTISHWITSYFFAVSFGMNLPVFSARYIRIAPDSNTV